MSAQGELSRGGTGGKGRSATQRSLVLAGLVTLGATWDSASGARAQTAEDAVPGEIREEEPDPTRLDVARLPPEAIEITRDLYARGFFLEAQLSALGFVGDLGRVASPGPRLAIALGYEITTWLSVLGLGEGSLHVTKNREPPGRTAFEMYGGGLGLQLGVPITARAMVFTRGIGSIVSTGGDVLHPLGFKEAHKLGVGYGAELAFDWHVKSRHHALGALLGARVLPSLSQDDLTVGAYGSLYLHYVF
jgi:hypothetical protein